MNNEPIFISYKNDKRWGLVEERKYFEKKVEHFLYKTSSLYIKCNNNISTYIIINPANIVMTLSVYFTIKPAKKERNIVNIEGGFNISDILWLCDMALFTKQDYCI
ncbi:MAG: hypothetical protein WC556_06575 [Candidatus Methanoperedens sp.]